MTVLPISSLVAQLIEDACQGEPAALSTSLGVAAQFRPTATLWTELNESWIELTFPDHSTTRFLMEPDTGA